ncbi:hypothetical protein BJ322DRAFT_1019393 [Thelephora terrestris]|uniref:Uncharacterized protein n=1 Tax=Thelephora terrestris TaxID=56493 RepID=A0A9P6L855_9AGAM|nr:hypothetical protein BJ322DRAFT_1019393 [Thelephora terrestris]
MRVLSIISALAAVVTAVAGAALPGNCGSEIGCDLAQLTAKRDFLAHDARDLTNSERLRRGLPLKSPILRRGTPVSRADPSGRPAPDPNTISHHGIIQVINAASGAVLGYISDSSMKRAQLRYQPGTDSALKVAFKTDKTGSGTNLNLVMKNSDTGFGLLGLVQGNTDTDAVLSSGSSQFAVLAGVAKPGTTPGSTPSKINSSYSSVYETMMTAETAIWTFDAVHGTLSPRWVNPDGSLPTVQPFTQSDDAIYVSGDVDAFGAAHKSTPTVITLKFVST